MPQDAKPLGLRERKKRETRRRIQATAIDLFAAHGFERVTVVQIAREADVSEATVFNYFATKEDLIFHGMAEAGHRLIAALRERPAGTSVVQAFRDRLARPRGILATADPGATAELVRVRRIIDGSPALQAREHMLSAAAAGQLASLFAEQSTDRVMAGFLASALIGVNRVLTEEICRLAADGRSGEEIAGIVLPQAVAAVDVVVRGLGAHDG